VLRIPRYQGRDDLGVLQRHGWYGRYDITGARMRIRRRDQARDPEYRSLSAFRAREETGTVARSVSHGGVRRTLSELRGNHGRQQHNLHSALVPIGMEGAQLQVL
jgi:hypothetical protein